MVISEIKWGLCRTKCSILFPLSAPEIDISPVPDIVPAVGTSCWFLAICVGLLYMITIEIWNLPVIVTSIKQILSITYEIVPDSDLQQAVISCTDCWARVSGRMRHKEIDKTSDDKDIQWALRLSTRVILNDWSYCTVQAPFSCSWCIWGTVESSI